MKDFIKFPSIPNFKNLSYALNSTAEFHNRPTEILKFDVSTKVHGTNAGIVFWRHENRITAQSRIRTLSPGKETDNHGFARWIDEEICLYGVRDMVSDINRELNQNMDAIVVYGEWCGGSIQGKVALSGSAEKHFVIFAVHAVDIKGGEVLERVELSTKDLKIAHKNVHNIKDFGSPATVSVNFGDPTFAIKALEIMKDDVEGNCPVGAKLNPESTCKTGEGVVLTHIRANGEVVRFKYKGEKHKRNTREPRINKIDTLSDEQNEALEVFLRVAVSGDRLAQGVEVMTELGHPPLIESTGLYLKWVMEDVLKETKAEVATLKGLDLEWRFLASCVSKAARVYWVDYLEEKNDNYLATLGA